MLKAYNVRFHKSINQDCRGCPDRFEECARWFWDIMVKAAHTMAVVCAVALNLPHDFFANMLADGEASVIRVLHYPVMESDNLEEREVVRAGEHTDFGLFTFLLTDSPGLQVKAIEGGEIYNDVGGADGWYDVPVPPAPTAIVNIGALMARVTNDVWKAAAHRVVSRRSSGLNVSRYSIACFFDPRPGVAISVHPKFVFDGQKPKYDPITANEYVQRRLLEAQSVH